MKILAGWAIFWTFLGLYLLAIRFILIWLAQFSGYPILLNLALVSLVVVILAAWSGRTKPLRFVPRMRSRNLSVNRTRECSS